VIRYAAWLSYPADVRVRHPLIRGLSQGADLALLGFLGLLILLDAALASSLATPAALVAPLTGAITAGAVAMRRRWPETATALAVACSLAASLVALNHDVFASAADVVGLLVLTAVVVRSTPRSAALVLAMGTGAAILGNALRTGSEAEGLVVIFGLLFAIAVASGGYLRWLDWQRVLAAADARRDERLDLAQELHDLVAHYVTGIVVQAQAAQVVAAQRPAAAHEALAQIEQAGTEALTAMRRLVGSLRSDHAAGDGPPAGTAGLRDLLDQYNASGVPARLQLKGVDPDRLPPAVATSVHRIVLESLTNVRRHGVDVTAVDVVVSRVRDGVQIVVRDNASGASPHGRPASRGGYGLVGMAERAAALGGTLAAGPTDAGGWEMQAWLPIDGDEPPSTDAPAARTEGTIAQ
jgi:signal transduction histidine kinase